MRYLILIIPSKYYINVITLMFLYLINHVVTMIFYIIIIIIIIIFPHSAPPIAFSHFSLSNNIIIIKKN